MHNDQSNKIQRKFESEVFDNNSLKKEIKNEFGPFSVHSKRKGSEMEETKFDDDDDYEEYYQVLDYQQPLVDQNQIMILHQQQQQWLQMIQMNNQLQTQINIKMMNYACTNIVKQKQSKKKKKHNK